MRSVTFSLRGKINGHHLWSACTCPVPQNSLVKKTNRLRGSFVMVSCFGPTLTQVGATQTLRVSKKRSQTLSPFQSPALSPVPPGSVLPAEGTQTLLPKRMNAAREEPGTPTCRAVGAHSADRKEDVGVAM